VNAAIRSGAMGAPAGSTIVPVEAYFDEARKLAMQIAQKAPIATRLAKEAVLKSLDTPLDEPVLARQRGEHDVEHHDLPPAHG